jgi:predicted aconitase
LNLTRTEERMLDGSYGEGTAIAMRLLVALGEVFEADRMIPVGSVQVSGVSYKTIRDPGIDFLEDLTRKGARAVVKATLNPAGMDLRHWRDHGVPENFANKQLRIVSAFKKMNVSTTCTCIPYYAGNKPRFGTDIAWAESSAVTFANSVLGAKTNREGGPAALASAIVGRTPLYGLHLQENRKPTHLVKLESRLNSQLDFSAFGYAVGDRIPQSVPLIEGLAKKPSLDKLKALGASMAAAGAIGLYHIRNVTPESDQFHAEDTDKLNRIVISEKEIREALQKLSTTQDFDHVCLGCPHMSLTEICNLAKRINGKKLKKPVWCFTSRRVHSQALKKGYVAKITRAGGKVINDTCMVVAPFEEMNIRAILTDSCKAAHYFPSMSKSDVTLGTLEQIVEKVT